MTTRLFLLSLFFASFTFAQQPASLGDVARAKRKAQPQNSKRVLTNEDISVARATKSPTDDSKPAPKTQASDAPTNLSLTPAEIAAVKAKVGRMKSTIAALESRRKGLLQWEEDHKSETAQCYGQQQAYGYSACDIVKEHKSLLERIESQLESSKSDLRNYQDEIRQMGYGSSVYDAN
jgi:hypothetical protein